MSAVLSPLSINPVQLGLEPCGDDTGGHPASCLLGTLRLGNCTMHVELIEVRDVAGAWKARNVSYQRQVDAAYALSGDSLTAMKHAGRQYIPVIYPYAA